MGQGMVHIYCGEGKGKTSAAIGLAVRALGHGMKVVMVQFLKGEASGERKVLRELQGMRLFPNPQTIPFSFQMTDEEKRAVLADNEKRMGEAFREAEGAGLLILDEALGAVSCGLLREERLIRFLEERPQGLEVVLTGRGPSAALLQRADYVTEMVCGRHPFDKGVEGRPGIEW